MIRVSVLMPVYNTRESYLKEAIESILNQSFSDFELIIIDDGSENNIENIIRQYTDTRIKFYKNEKNLGVGKTRNRLLELVQGEYAAFQDSDDIAMPLRLEKQVKFLDENPDISIVGSYLQCFPKNKIIKLPKNPKIIDFLGGCMLSQPSAMFRVNDFKKYNIKYNPELRTSEDYDFFARASLHLSFANIQESLVKYRINQNSLYHRANKYAYKIDKNIKQQILNSLTDDIILQKRIIKIISKHYQKKKSFMEKLFSIRNEWHKNDKYKVLILFGLKIKLYKLREQI